VKALVYTAKEQGMHLQIVEATELVNAEQKKYMVGKVLKHFKGDVKGKVFALWGVAFKANTDDIRETPAIETARALVKAGAKVRFYDPEASENFQSYMNSIEIPVDGFENKYDALSGADGVIVLTEWKQFRAPDFEEMKSRLREKVIFDGRNLYNTHKVLELGFKYYAVGKRIP
jgi:UDPglucose 6-dehydrogenase